VSSATTESVRAWDYGVVMTLVTQERMGSYLSVVRGDVELAFARYEWNIEASASVISLSSVVEVVVRNAIDRELVAWAERVHGTGASWFDHAPLDPKGRRDLENARSRATRRGRDREVHGKVIAELSLGFWRYLVESRYHTSLWVPAIHRAFPDGSRDLRRRRGQVALQMQQLQFVRNRAAHHEPIHCRDLDKDMKAAESVMLWVSPDAAAWMAAVCSLREVIARKPH
jgi:hypothetical protein